MNLINKFIYDYSRRKMIKEVIPDIGEVIEEEDRFICNVSQREIDNRLDEYNYKLGFRGFRSLDKDDNRLFFNYGLEKDVYYVFDGVIFYKQLEFYSTNDTYVIFKNCTFICGISVLWADDVSFINNSYYGDYSKYVFGKNYMYNMHNMYKMIRNLRFINDNFNCQSHNKKNSCGVNLDVECLELIDTNMVFDKGIFFNIKSDILKIDNSSILVDEFYLDSDNILIDDRSKIKVNSGMIIENGSGEVNFNNIDSLYLVYNGMEIVSDKFNSNDGDLLLKEGREKFLSVITAIFDKVREVNLRKLNEVRENLDSRSLKRILKK